MFFDFIYENSIVLGIVIVLIVLFLNKRYGFEFMTTESKLENVKETNDTKYCDDINCVRCRKYSTILDEALMKLLFVPDSEIAERIKNGINHGGFEYDQRQQPNVFYYKQLESKPVWVTEKLPDCAKLENAFESIQKEFFAIALDESGFWKRNRTPTGSWDVFHLINQGESVADNAKLCPNTMAVIRTLESVINRNVLGNVMFSVVKPETLISEHFGPTNIRLRCHLGINVTPECILAVDEETTFWTSGKCLVFDDSFLHSVTHFGEKDKRPISQTTATTTTLLSSNTEAVGTTQVVSGSEYRVDGDFRTASDDNKHFDPNHDRVVLIVDLWHPDLTVDEQDAINLVFAP